MMKEVYLVILVAFILTISGSLLAPVEPLYLKDITGDYSIVGYIIGLSSLSFIVFSPLMGSLSDIIGRKRAMLVLLLMGPPLRILMGTVKDVIMAASLRFASGIVATFAIIFLAYVGDILEGVPRKNFFYSIYIAAVYLGSSIGNIIAGICTKELKSFFPVYLLSSIFFAISSLLVCLYTKEKITKKITKRRKKWRINPQLLLIIFIVSILNFYWGLKGYLWPIVVENIVGRDAAFYTSVIYFLADILPIFILPVAGRWGDRIGSWPLLFLGWSIVGITGLLMPAAIWNFALFALLTIYFEIGVAIRSPAVNSLIVENTKKETRGLFFGIITSLSSIFYSLSSFFAGFLLEEFSIPIVLLLYGSLLYSSFISSIIFYIYIIKRCKIEFKFFRDISSSTLRKIRW